MLTGGVSLYLQCGSILAVLDLYQVCENQADCDSRLLIAQAVAAASKLALAAEGEGKTRGQAQRASKRARKLAL